MKIKLKPQVEINTAAIQRDIEKFGRTFAETVAQEAQRVIMKFAEEQMWGYYLEYDPPRIYDRTFQMAEKSYQPYYARTGNTYEGGVRINSAFTNHARGSNDFSESDLYDMVWIEGYHGQEKVGYPQSYWTPIKGEPDRINLLKKKAYGSQLKNKIISKGMAKAKAQSYSILKFR